MKKYYCASCGYEKSVYHDFMHVSGNLEFCKICACATRTRCSTEKDVSDLDYSDINELKNSSHKKTKPAEATENKIETKTEPYNQAEIIAELAEKKTQTKKKRNRHEKKVPVIDTTKTPFNKPLDEQIKNAWRECASKRAWVVDHWNEHKEPELKPEPKPELEKPKKKSRPSRVMTEEELQEIRPDLRAKWIGIAKSSAKRKQKLQEKIAAQKKKNQGKI